MRVASLFAHMQGGVAWPLMQCTQPTKCGDVNHGCAWASRAGGSWGQQLWQLSHTHTLSASTPAAFLPWVCDYYQCSVVHQAWCRVQVVWSSTSASCWCVNARTDEAVEAGYCIGLQGLLKVGSLRHPRMGRGGAVRSAGAAAQRCPYAGGRAWRLWSHRVSSLWLTAHRPALTRRNVSPRSTTQCVAKLRHAPLSRVSLSSGLVRRASNGGHCCRGGFQ